MTAEQVIELLRVRYPKAAWAFLTNVANGTGGAARRYGDVIVMSLWPSRGLEIIGIEIKVSRSDWKRELEKPEKADCLFRYCDKWCLAVSDPAIVQPGELPKGWGLLIPDGKGSMRCSVDPEQNRAVEFNREFLAAVLRRTCEQITPEAELESAKKTAELEGFKLGEASSQCWIDDWKRRFADLEQIVSNFERTSGISIRSDWSYGETVGAAVARVLRGEEAGAVARMKRLRDQASAIVAALDKSLAVGLLLALVCSCAAPQPRILPQPAECWCCSDAIRFVHVDRFPEATGGTNYHAVGKEIE